ncbi:Rieske 2Fe-2S domain-containing protein [Solimonas terrae]|uniref:Rieske 2Fe-2S domain-containing protein n=1 Tax=Solimonas terrae TaxID=1396819 RepID=A0A6M2BRI8_9GAMM|nr:Rieske 2Fe-2S domain-containing protein [Solimonas terrae]NGY04865.1 Rieske 2Fe-2S domain-containing protein [Solimonas terrae]
MGDEQRHGGDLNYAADTLKRSSAATVQRNLQTIPRLADGSPRYARGWHMVGWSDEFPAGEVVPRDYFGMRLAFYRGEDGSVRCLDAFCPHLGADLSAGKVIGNELQCPFHNWQYNGAGTCVKIPYCDKIPARAKTRSFATREMNDTVLIWFDPEFGEPDYEIPPLADFFPAGAADSQGWTKGWRRFRITIRTHPREVIENTVDKGHLLPIHGYDVDRWLPVWNGHMTGELMWGTHTRLAADVQDDKLYVRSISHGPSYQYTWQTQDSQQFDSAILTAWCPIDENTLEYWFGVIVKANAAEFPPEALEMAAQGYCEASYQAFMEDVYIWERKLYRAEPMLCANDGPIAKLRRWYAQFYTDRAKLPKPLHNHNHEWTVHDLRDRQAEVIAAQEAESVSA